LIVGLARSGQAAALALRARGEQVIGLDCGHPPGVDSLADAGVELHLGDGDGVPLLSRVATVVKSPGVSARVPVIEQAQIRAVSVVGELELAWRMLPNEFVAVTGTNGKTTTVELIGHIHRVAGLPVAVAGNVGAALSGFVGGLDPKARIICEVSSFQLEDTVDFAPEVGVLLNLAPDHLDRHGTLAAYTEAKLRIFAHQGVSDIAVLPVGLDPGPIPGAARRMSFGERLDVDLSLIDGTLRWREEVLLQAGEVRIPGRHNLENAMAAAAACLARGLDPRAVSEGLRTFAGVAHRLEPVAEVAGVKYVNDSKATNVASTLVALRACTDRILAEVDRDAAGAGYGDGESDVANVHLILGGQGKGQDFSALRGAVQKSCRGVYLIGEDAPLIAAALAAVEISVESCERLDRAVELARKRARAGETVLLSPACASFDQFTDFQARGERFRELVGGIGGSTSK
jgi:UDP-N-acetylmuramoylalanine--D-glutamate ligase